MFSNLMELPDEQLKEKIRSEFGLNKQNIQEALEVLKKWMQQQPHLPKYDDDRRMERFLLDSKNSIEKVKTSIESYYTSKSSPIYSDIMSGWDVGDEWVNNALKAMNAYVARKLTSEGDRIICFSFTEDADSFDPVSFVKLAVIFMEIRTHEDYWRSHIIIIDMKFFSLAHIPKTTSLPLLKKCHDIIMKVFKLRITSMHFLNVPHYASLLINLVKSIASNKIVSRIHIHDSDLTEFYKQDFKRLLPSDYGGEGTSILENRELWYQGLLSIRDWILERENVKSDETKRQGKTVECGDIFGFEGTFRKLNVD